MMRSLFLLVLALAAPRAAAQTPAGLAGEWRLTGSATSLPAPTGDYLPSLPPAPFRLAFADDGRVRIEAGADLRHVFSGDTLVLRTDAHAERLAAHLVGDTFTMTDPDDGTVLVFAREGGAASDGLVGRWVRPDADLQGANGPPAGLEFAADGTSRAFYVATMGYTVQRGTLSVGDPMPFQANVRVAGDRMTLVQKHRVSRYVRAPQP